MVHRGTGCFGKKFCIFRRKAHTFLKPQNEI